MTACESGRKKRRRDVMRGRRGGGEEFGRGEKEERKERRYICSRSHALLNMHASENYT